MEYTLIRSRRRTLSLSVREDGSVLVRAPMRTGKKEIGAFVEKYGGWIEKQRQKLRQRQEADGALEPISPQELERLRTRAKEILPEKAARFADALGVSYGTLTVRAQKTRWGSCTAKGNLSFNCLLMLAPDGVIDAVVAHEICHRKEMNHSERFYRHLYRIYPEYDRWNRWLKDNGRVLMKRMEKGQTEKDG